MSTSLVRLVVAAWVAVLLVRAGRAAWHQRALVRLVWSRIRPRHVLGSLALLVVVLSTAIVLLTTVPWLGYGLGSLIGLGGNAVFAPLEEAVARSGAAAGGGPDWFLALVATVFLGALGALLPWLAFVEEEVFRAGLEDASLPREIGAALLFGLAHLIMLVPVAAGLAIAVAGLTYSRIYRRAYHRVDPAVAVPRPVARAFRPTRRSARAAERARAARTARAPVDPGALEVVDLGPERRQAQAVLASTVWHTTFNTLVVTLVWLSVLAGALWPPGG